MKLTEIIKDLNLSVFQEGEGDPVIKSGYAGDLLSDVMGNAAANSIWVTIQPHQNIVAVSLLANIPAVILSRGVKPHDLAIEKAKEEGIWLLGTDETSFEIIGRLYSLGIKGTKR